MNKWIVAIFLLVIVSCNNKKSPRNDKNSIESKIVRISVDESFEPVMKEEIKVFEAAYPDAKVVAEYKSEAACLRDLQKDSIKIVVISRELNRNETAFFDEKISYKPEFAELAKDAVAVIINSANKDSSFTLSALKKMLDGTNNHTGIVTDGNTATSTVRYLKDSLLHGVPFGNNVTGARSSEDLVRYISTTPGAIGFIGISWVTNPQNDDQEKLLKNVKIAMVECKNCDKDIYAKPSQQTITFNQYPLVRGLYYVLKENYAGMGSRLIEFLCTERGQLIFRRASLVPAKINFSRRRII